MAWECPENHPYALFLLTAFYLDASGSSVLQEVRLWPRGCRFTLADLEPCCRVHLGLQTVCQAGAATRYSRMEQVDGNAGQRT